MEIYLEKISKFGKTTTSRDLVCIKRIEKEKTQIVNVYLRHDGGGNVEFDFSDESYLDELAWHSNHEWQESTYATFWKGYAEAQNTLHSFQLSINKK